MQTFLPYSNPIETAAVLDDKRLGKQRVEAIQIARSLLGLSKGGWSNHPAVKMWRGYESYLVRVYLDAMMNEWGNRGYRNIKTVQHLQELTSLTEGMSTGTPWWFDNGQLFISHRSNLIRKKPEHYQPLWPDVPDDLEYIWPVS